MECELVSFSTTFVGQPQPPYDRPHFGFSNAFIDPHSLWNLILYFPTCHGMSIVDYTKILQVLELKAPHSICPRVCARDDVPSRPHPLQILPSDALNASTINKRATVEQETSMTITMTAQIAKSHLAHSGRETCMRRSKHASGEGGRRDPPPHPRAPGAPGHNESAG